MGTFINYLLESSLLMCLFVTFYLLILRRNATPLIGRIYLLLSLVLVVTVPFLHFDLTTRDLGAEFSADGIDNENPTLVSELSERLSYDLAFVAAESYNTLLETSLEPIIRKHFFLHIIYYIGLLILFIRVLTGFVKLKLLKNKYKVIYHQGKRLIIAGNNYQPFSFLNIIVIPNEVWNSEYREGIIAHEAAHINQKHSLDMLMNELILLFQWFNPFAWLNKRFIRENHEFLADKKVVETQMEVKQYKEMLLFRVMGMRFDLGDNFNSSLTNKRFKLLSQKINKNKVLLSSLSSVLLMMGSVLFFGCTNVGKNSELNDKIVFGKRNHEIYKASNISDIRVEGVTHTSDYIIIDIAPYDGDQEFEIPKGTYITPGNNSAVKYRLKKARGQGQLNVISKSHKGYRLYFPRIDESIGAVHLKGNTEKSLQIFDIELWDKNRYNLKQFNRSSTDTTDVRIVNNPRYTAKSSTFIITKVVVGKEYTALDFEIDLGFKSDSGSFLVVPTGSCICPSIGGENLYVKTAEGIEIGAHLHLNGLQKYTLIFPPLPEGTRYFNFKELNGGGNWAAYEIDLES